MAGIVSNPTVDIPINPLAIFLKGAIDCLDINVVGTAIDKLSEIGNSETLEVLDKVSARFSNEAYIQFAIRCVRHAVAGEEI